MTILLIYVGLVVARIVIEAIVNPRVTADAPLRRDEAASLAVLVLSHAVSALAVGYCLLVATSVSIWLFVVGCLLFAGETTTNNQHLITNSQ